MKIGRYFLGILAVIADLITVFPILLGSNSNNDGMLIFDINVNTFRILLFLLITTLFISALIYWKLKDKIVAMKTFRDKEMVRITDHFNSQLHTFEIRMKVLQDKLKEHDITINIADKKEGIDPNAVLNEKSNTKNKMQEIIEYNKAFSNWGIGNYGIGDNQTIYKSEDYTV